MAMSTNAPKRRRLLWAVLLVCVLLPPVLYAVLPTAAAAVLTHFLHRQGYQHVAVQVGYPGWRTLQVPLLSFQQEGEAESLAVTVRDSRLEYDVGVLLSGRIDRLIIPHASVVWRERNGHDGQTCPPSQTAGPGLLAGVTAGHLVRPVPALPLHTLVVEQMQVFRACATGPLRDVTLSGTLHQVGTAVEGSVVLQGQETSAYRLQFTMPQVGDIDVALHPEPAAPSPIVAIQSQVRQGPSGIQLMGKATADFVQLAPFVALAMPIGTELQRVAGTLQAEWTGTVPLTTALDTAWRDPATTVSGTVELTLMLPRLAGVGDNLSVQLHGTVTGNAEQLTWALAQDTRLGVDLERVAFPPPGMLSWLVPPKDRRVVITCPQSVQGQVRLAAQPLQFAVQGPIRMTYGAPQAPLHLEVAILRAAARGTEQFTAEATYRLRGGAEQIPADMLVVQAAQWDLRGTLALADTQLQGTLAASSGVQVHDIRQAEVQVPAGTVQLTADLPFTINLGTRQWGAGPAHIAIQTPHVVWQDTSVSIKQASVTLHKLQGNRGHWQTSGALHLADVSAQLPAVQLPATQWHTDFAIDDTMLRLEAKGTAFDAAITLVSQLEYGFASRAGTAQLHLQPMQLDSEHLSWNKLLAPLALPVEVTGGRLAATASLAWQPDAGQPESGAVPSTGRVTLTLDQLSGQYESVLVQGLTTTLQLHTAEADTLIMPEPATVTIAALQTGVEVTDVSLQLQLGLTNPTTLAWAELRNMSASVLGGRVTSEGLRFEPVRPEHTLLVKVEHLDLQQLLQLEQQEGVEGTGFVDGVIPIRLTPAGVQVQDGRLEARPPGGHLRYQSSPEAAQDLVALEASRASEAPLQLVLQALSNFHYNVLQLGVQYQEDGTLNLSAKLEGTNPDWREGRPIHFNLNVQENVLTLLKSLRIVQGIQQAIEEHYQKQ